MLLRTRELPQRRRVARGVVVDASGAPVRGAFVQILNEQGQQIKGVLAGEQGEFVVAHAGRPLLAAHRSHWSSDQHGADVRAGRPTNARLSHRAGGFGAAAARAERARRQPLRGPADGNRQTAEVWAEARKALALTAWTENNSRATFSYRNHNRTLDLKLREKTPPQVRTSSLSGQRAFHSVHPDTLALHGYIRQRPGMNEVHGPDAELLLSNSFVNLHCFRLERRKDLPGLIGLAFEPIRGRKLPEIKGALWLDERSAELRFIEFGYVNMRYFEDQRYTGGRTEFRQLPNGAWIVSRWYVRAPILGRGSGLRAVRVTGAIEQGGEVLDVRVDEARSGPTDFELQR